MKKNKRKIKDFTVFKPIVVDGITYERYVINADEEVHVYDMVKKRFVKDTKNKDGYHKIWLNLINGRKKKALHRVVAETFIENPLNKPAVNHIDGNKSNNCISNLEWVTNAENVRHSIDTGLRPTVLTKKKVHEICRLLEENKLNQIEIAEKCHCDEHSVRGIRRGTIWTRISKKYKIPPVKKRSDKPNANFKPYYDKVDDLILQGLRNEEIIEMMPIENATAHNYQTMICRQRRKLNDKYYVITV